MPRQFKFNGDPKARGGKIMKIRVPKKDGTHIEIVGNPGVGIPPGQLMQIEDDPRALRVLRADPRFTETV